MIHRFLRFCQSHVFLLFSAALICQKNDKITRMVNPTATGRRRWVRMKSHPTHPPVFDQWKCPMNGSKGIIILISLFVSFSVTFFFYFIAGNDSKNRQNLSGSSLEICFCLKNYIFKIGVYFFIFCLNNLFF